MTAEERAKRIVDDGFGRYAGKRPSDPDDNRSFWQYTEDLIAAAIRDAVAEAVSAEREACAKVASGMRGGEFTKAIVRAIRARGEKK